jgi:proline iminopeptidase
MIGVAGATKWQAKNTSMAFRVRPDGPALREGYARIKSVKLFFRAIGRGRPIVVIHGGPDFDHGYLLPELDSLSDCFYLLYYDQRGRGRSADRVRPEDVNIESEIEDLEGLREYFGLRTMAVLGHSWGGVLAMEYAVRHPNHVSHLILMNTAPASHDDYALFRQDRLNRNAADLGRLRALSSTDKYQEGDLEAEAEYYRVHFQATLRQQEHLEKIIGRLRANFTKESVLKAREIEKRLNNETWLSSEYNLLPKLQPLRIPTLILHGDHDLFPVECVAHIAQAIPGARLVLLRDCGHFAYLERPDEVHKEVTDFLNAPAEQNSGT